MLYHWEIYLGGHRYTCLMPLSDIVTGHRTVCCLNLLMTHFVDKEENQTTTVAIYSTDTLYRCEHINLYFCFTSKLPDHRLCMTKVKDKTTKKKILHQRTHKQLKKACAVLSAAAFYDIKNEARSSARETLSTQEPCLLSQRNRVFPGTRITTIWDSGLRSLMSLTSSGPALNCTCPLKIIKVNHFY